MASTFISLSSTTSSTESVDVVVVGVNEFKYGEAQSLAIGGSAVVVTHTFTTSYKLRRVSCTGDNVGEFTVLFDGSPVDKKRSTFTNYNCEFDYETGITIPANTVVEIEVVNASASSAGNFSAQLLFSAV